MTRGDEAHAELLRMLKEIRERQEQLLDMAARVAAAFALPRANLKPTTSDTDEPSGVDDRPTLKPKAVAERLYVSLATAIELMKSGRVRAVNVGTRAHNYWRTSERWLRAFQRSQTAA